MGRRFRRIGAGGGEQRFRPNECGTVSRSCHRIFTFRNLTELFGCVIRQAEKFLKKQTTPHQIMKPTPRISTLPTSSRQDRVSLRRKPRSPRLDYNFQPMIGERSGDEGSLNRISPSEGRPSFRDISREFLREETHQGFCAELFLFGVIILISAWPVFALVEAWTALPG
jgi:hypothetical protein